MSVKSILKLTLLIFGLFVVTGIVEIGYETTYRLIYGRASYSAEAVFQVPNSRTEIVLERRAAHLFLAEYERTLVLRIGDKEVLRKEVAEDTGGYSRMNVYRVSPRQYFLSGALNFDNHELDVQGRNIF